MEPYILFSTANRDSAQEGVAFHTTRRTRWTVTLRVSSLESGGSVAVALEGGPTMDEDGFATLYDFGTVSAEEETIVHSFEVDQAAADFAMDESNLYIRGNISANTGDYVLELLAASRFWDPGVDAHREDLTKMLKTSNNDLERFMSKAERDVVRFLMLGLDGTDGTLNINTAIHDAQDIIRLAVVEQGNWLAYRETMANSKNYQDRKDAIRNSGLAPAAEEMLDEVTTLTGRVWRGR